MGLNLGKALSGAVGGFLTGGPAGAIAGGIAGALSPEEKAAQASFNTQLNTQTDTSSTENVISNQDTTNQIDTLSSLIGSGATTGVTTGETTGVGTAVIGPSDLALPGIEQLLAGASANLGAPATAGFTDPQLAGQLLQTGVGGAADQIGALGQQTAETQTFLSSTDLLSPESNPFLASSIQASINPLLKNLMETILPGISGGATAVGGIGGSRQGVAEAGAIGNFLETAGNISAQQSSDAFQQGVNTLQQSQGNANPLAALLQQPGTLLQQVGGTQQGQGQLELDETNKKLLEFANLIGSQNLGTQAATTQVGTSAGTQAGTVTSQQTGTGSSTQAGNVSGTVDTSKTGTTSTEAIKKGTSEATPGQLDSGAAGAFGAGLTIGDFLNGTPPGTSTPVSINSPFPARPDGARIAVGGQQQ